MPSGLAALAATGENHRLKSLVLSHCNMRDLGAACVAVMMVAGDKLEKVRRICNSKSNTIHHISHVPNFSKKVTRYLHTSHVTLVSTTAADRMCCRSTLAGTACPASAAVTFKRVSTRAGGCWSSKWATTGMFQWLRFTTLPFEMSHVMQRW